MDSAESLSHSRRECEYHVLFIPKCRRKALCVYHDQFFGWMMADLSYGLLSPPWENGRFA